MGREKGRRTSCLWETYDLGHFPLRKMRVLPATEEQEKERRRASLSILSGFYCFFYVGAYLGFVSEWNALLGLTREGGRVALWAPEENLWVVGKVETWRTREGLHGFLDISQVPWAGGDGMENSLSLSLSLYLMCMHVCVCMHIQCESPAYCNIPKPKYLKSQQHKEEKTIFS